ncbi:MAG: hypothetical protein JNG88_16320, partial [Phycisphaerales bacterium]|nr:hypothetical protein [Phycisphaerales bacterium]
MQRPIMEIDATSDGTPSHTQAYFALRSSLRGISLRVPEGFASFGPAVPQNDCAATDAEQPAPFAMLDFGRLPAPLFTGITHRDRESCTRVVAWLDMALTRATDALVMPLFSAGSCAAEAFSYADALSHLYRMLCVARHEAEQRGMTILIDAPGDRFLLSP